jgi:hypothetical protein
MLRCTQHDKALIRLFVILSEPLVLLSEPLVILSEAKDPFHRDSDVEEPAISAQVC